MARMLTLLIDVLGVSESEPFTFDFSFLLADIGNGFFVTGTPVTEVSPNDGFIVIGAPVLDTTSQKVQVHLSATPGAAGRVYRLTCRANCSDGVTTAIRICTGSLGVVQWSQP